MRGWMLGRSSSWKASTRFRSAATASTRTCARISSGVLQGCVCSLDQLLISSGKVHLKPHRCCELQSIARVPVKIYRGDSGLIKMQTD